MKESSIEYAVDQINKGDAACIIIKNNNIIAKEMGRGVKPILSLYQRGVLKDACVVDKVVGKAAAMVMTHAGVKRCYAITISMSAYNWLEKHGVTVEYTNLVDYIINRSGDGMCPMECATRELEDDKKIVEILHCKLIELNKKKVT